MRTEKAIGYGLIAGSIGILIPFTILTHIFEYPAILRQDTSIVLTKFHEGGSALIFTWWAFAILGLPLLIAYSLIGQELEGKISFIRWVTTIGIISGMAQIIGLLRWVFVIPVLAETYVTAADASAEKMAILIFEILHQFAGVLLGEHIGQLFTIIWTIMISYAFIRLAYFPKWIPYFGIIASVMYLVAQAELFTTVIPGFPFWSMAGFVGSTLWLLWLIIVGVAFVRKKNGTEDIPA